MSNNKIIYLSPRDLIDKCVLMGFISDKNKEELLQEYNKLDSTILLMEKLYERGLLSELNIKTIASSLGNGKLVVYDSVYDIFGSNTPFITSGITKELFLESIKFHFNEKYIAIYDIKHKEKEIHVIVPIYPTEDIINLIKEFKQKSENIKKNQKVDIKQDNGVIVTEERNMSDYKFKIKIAPIGVIRQVLTANMETGDILTKGHEQVKKQIEKQGFNISKKTEIISIIGNIDENKDSIEGQVQYILEASNSKFGRPASDIHFEPYLHKEGGQIRFRVNGELTKPEPAPALDQYILELKRMANMNINKRQIKQDGKISLNINGVTYLFRASTLPIGEQKQEKMVLRRLTNDPSELDLKKLKMDERFQNILYDIVGDPKNGKVGNYRDGLILMTGPTGSGKSTTLFSILNHLNTHEVNIITLEDPIEYELPGINQSYIFHSSGKVGPQEDPNDLYTFEEGIKSALRQDPDIILVGEIRDSTTMNAAQVAATTGHLVLSSLHTNNTWETLNRLIGLGLEIDLIQATVRLIMAQRLAQYVCPYCKKEYNDFSFSTTFEEKARRDNEYLRMKIEVYTSLLETDYISELPDNIEDLKIYQGLGCPNCHYTGKVGRVGVYEFLPIDLDIQDFLLEKGVKASKNDIRELFIKKGIITLFQNALYKVVKGVKQDKLDEKGNPQIYYLDYNSAKSSAGGDIYGYSKKFKDLDIKTLEKLILKKKKEREMKILKNEKDKVLYELDGLKFTNSAEVEAIKKPLRKKIEELDIKINEVQNIINSINI